MKLLEAIQSLGVEESLKCARELSVELNLDWDADIRFVFSVIANDVARIPGNVSGKTAELAIKKWLEKIKAGFDNRPSQRISNLPGTVADPIIETIIKARLGQLSVDDLVKIIFAHRLSMSAENLLGLLLEEYLAIRLREYGWHCAWGETVKLVDFVSEQGVLLQVKNRSNSENSASGSVRAGTAIVKWHRIEADRIEYRWEELNQICGTKELLSEIDFVEFAVSSVKQNPSSLAIEKDNPWKSDSPI